MGCPSTVLMVSVGTGSTVWIGPVPVPPGDRARREASRESPRCMISTLPTGAMRLSNPPVDPPQWVRRKQVRATLGGLAASISPAAVQLHTRSGHTCGPPANRLKWTRGFYPRTASTSFAGPASAEQIESAAPCLMTPV